MPRALQLEPDSARTYCVNLVRARIQFAVEIDPRKIKDIVIVYRGAVLTERAGWQHLRQRATDVDAACQYVHNLVNAEQTFEVRPERVGDRWEWLILTELRSSGRREA